MLPKLFYGAIMASNLPGTSRMSVETAHGIDYGAPAFAAITFGMN
jgi:hypothetical protein